MDKKENISYYKRKNKDNTKNGAVRLLEENKELFSSIKEIIAIATAIGLIVGSFILYRYFSMNSISQQPLDTLTILTTSLNFLVVIGGLSAVSIISSVYIYIVLKKLKDKKEVPKLLVSGVLRSIAFWIIFILVAISKEIITFISFFIIIFLFIYKGEIDTYAKDKFFKDGSHSVMSFDFIFPYFALVVLTMLSLITNRFDYEMIVAIFLIPFILFALPYFYHMLFPQKKSNITFTIYIFSIAVFLLFFLASAFFTERAVMLLNVGVKTYDELVLDKDECNRLKTYKRLGYECDENFTLKSMYGVWIIGKRPIFQKAKIIESKESSFIRPQMDKNSTQIWLHRDKIYTVL
ncbi:hypothetical protein [Sulfurovum mangrovi]|uniref:hypothetical protein n=1 Tax=Sulfurovum mangrovi TaxID=2893889 RepID=UPI001E4F67F2|nr:hypothetical protein [Sulfurovum mangrovi]UFH58338.1 hypothetical protein LN246_08245 [Sulfurovum mangrovi]